MQQLPKFVRALTGSGRKVLYFTADGRIFVFTGGDLNWRNNNPGNLKPGKVSKRNGAIGKGAEGFAIFPSYEIGHQALIDSLLNFHGNQDLEEMIKGYAPKEDNNDTAGKNRRGRHSFKIWNSLFKNSS